ncbi:hypothetical protein QUO07_004388 [Vibrio parahaemolyticus]|uniref:hypothetical protein n=1 Tax=Vibrio parahaemolyticus TaxID=670 RepID=UPI00084B26F1|nr:hypothetical protein [Vibrio parahaemolyticus]EGQ7830417.1 hypothetical protein [Vibrio parahaemolyticus]EGQ9828487.1 hypothetical protein [Vibrio parahaemolyticus]EHH1253264.1 hypothetical protein [Vibrio parahaemolyticus]EHR6658667.1 hypothetical protein [Vibrio parahaemolyticus]EJG2057689.1 hypothetical protein [Vibrio parahaemolyticus]
MEKIPFSRKNNPVSYEALDNEAKEKYHNLRVEDLVIDHCIETGFIKLTDVTTKTRKFLVLKETIETTLNAFKLVDDFDDTNITIDNLDACIDYKKKLKQRVLKVVSDKLLASLPNFR